MADIARSTSVKPEMSRCMFAPQIKGIAGVAIAAGQTIYQKAADGKLYLADGDAANEAAIAWGIAPKAYALGESAMAFGLGAKFGRYCNVAQNVGTYLYVSTTAGALGTTASPGCPIPVAIVVAPINGAATGTDIEFITERSAQKYAQLTEVRLLALEA